MKLTGIIGRCTRGMGPFEAAGWAATAAFLAAAAFLGVLAVWSLAGGAAFHPVHLGAVPYLAGAVMLGYPCGHRRRAVLRAHRANGGRRTSGIGGGGA